MQSKFRHWSDAAVFLAVLRAGSTLAAAKSLGMTQTTVARRIDALEASLGLTLFERDTRGFHPTDAANALSTPAEEIERAAAAFGDTADRLAHQASGPIRVTGASTIIRSPLSSIFSEFSAANPGVTFEFITGERILDLSAGEADVAIRSTDVVTDETLIARRVGVIHWTLYATPAYIAAHGAPASMDDLEDHNLVTITDRHGTRPNVFRCETELDMMMAIRSGSGVAPMPCMVGDAQPDLVRCCPPPEPDGLPTWLLTSPAAHRRPEVRRFTAFAAPRIAAFLREAARNER